MADHKENKALPHLFVIDILRGFAALSVCVFHFTGSTDLAKTVAHWGKYGYLGVEVFFVISGFIIPLSMQKNNYTFSGFFTFIAKRLTRISFPYIMMILVTLLFIYFTRKAYMPSMNSILLNFIYLQTFFGYESISPIIWTLIIEFQFYIFIGLCFHLVSHHSTFLFVFFIQFLFLCFLCFTGANLFGYLGFFILGIILFRSIAFKINPILYWLLIGQCVLLIAYKNGLMESMVSATTYLTIAYIKVDIKLLVARVLIAIGTISYSLYLIHWEFGRALIALSKYVPIVKYHESLRISFGLGGTILGAIVFYILVEKPSIKLSKTIKSLS